MEIGFHRAMRIGNPYRVISIGGEVLPQLLNLKKCYSILHVIGMNLTISQIVLVPGKRYPEAGVCKAHGKKSVRITNSPLVFPDTSSLGQVAHGEAGTR